MADGPTLPEHVLGAPVDLGGTGYYVHWGVLQISAANLVVIALMLIVFALALLLPFPRGRQRR
ncbi:hypothetical protein OG936_35655 [Streptomyces sp. NBC_00846]|uniref:hypothetical protein n=1 Tax=Streptomyces sp. NBC_00846 TaxID=2975849 RepID=UPI00387035B7|nr:hypothetical protein OG936_35655 [Streptomyces sp. NBC_00846]